MGKSEEEELPISIPEFYKDKSVFVTGFTGAIGKVLVEKLLYSCPEIDKIYVLVRPKKNQDPLLRTEEVFQSKAFSRVREKYPGALETKVIPVAGDISQKEFGMSDMDKETLRNNVSIIFHGAALVKMDDPITSALRMNTRGTKEMVDLALTMPHLKCFVYISTAYTNCDHIYIKEELYPPKANWREFLKVSEKINTSHLHILSKKYINEAPNTYVFTKSLSEHIINDYRDQLPVVIARPSIVVPSHKEPVPGWVDNKYGPIALILGFLFGIVRCSWIDNKQTANYIISDCVVNATIIIAWKTALTINAKAPGDAVSVYNISTPQEFNVTHEEFSKLYKVGDTVKCLNKLNINRISLMFIKNRLWYWINILFRHLLPAAIIDLGLMLAKKKPLLVSIRRKVYIATEAISYFADKTFIFENEKFVNLQIDLKPEDRDAFGWDFAACDKFAIYDRAFENLQTNMLKPLFDDLPTYRKLLLGLYLVDKGAVVITFTIFAWLLYAFSVPQHILSFLVGLVYF